MGDDPAAVLIATLCDAGDYREMKKQISKIKGVRSVELCGLSGKLRVRYDRDPKTNMEIQAQIKRVIESY